LAGEGRRVKGREEKRNCGKKRRKKRFSCTPHMEMKGGEGKIITKTLSVNAKKVKGVS